MSLSFAFLIRRLYAYDYGAFITYTTAGDGASISNGDVPPSPCIHSPAFHSALRCPLIHLLDAVPRGAGHAGQRRREAKPVPGPIGDAHQAQPRRAREVGEGEIGGAALAEEQLAGGGATELGCGKRDPAHSGF